MEDTIAVLIPFAGMALAFGIVYINTTTRNKEKMFMLEKGFTPEEIKKERGLNIDIKGKTITRACLFIGVGIGLLLGHLLTTNYNINKFIAYTSCSLIFGGIGLLIGHFASKDKNKSI